MSEQQTHLSNLLEQRQTLIDEINELQQQITQKKELALRASGAIEYLQQVGVTLPEGAAPAEEAGAVESVESEVVEPPAEG